MKLAYT